MKTATATGDGDATQRSARATLESVAARAGVSRQTVSNVLNAPHLVREATAARVHAAVRELHYRPHLAALQLRTRQSHVLGLRVEPSPGDGVFDRFLHALTDAAAKRDYRIMLYTAGGDDAEIAAYSELYHRWDLDGFVLTSTHPDDARTAHLAESGIPCVTFGRPWDASDHHPWVDVDGAAGTRAATEHLLASGHEHISFLGWPAGPGVGDDRLAGWHSAMSAAALPTNVVYRSANTSEEGRHAAAALLGDSDITAVVCASDVLAMSMRAEAIARGRSVDSELAVIGFDDTDVAQMVGMSSVRQPLEDVARACIRIIVDGIDAAPRSPEHVLLPPELVIRA